MRGYATQRAGEKIILTKEDIKKDETKDLDNENKQDEQESKTYTQEELDNLLQSQTDKRVSQALETAKAKWQEEYQARLEEEKSEAEKLASMSAEERAKAEFEKEKEEWLKEKSSFEKEKMKLEATKLLSAEGLPIAFVDYVVSNTPTAEEVAENVKTFSMNWAKALDEAVTEKLKGKSPVSSGLQNKDIVNMTKEEFGKLPYKERVRMLNIDPEIVGKLKD